MSNKKHQLQPGMIANFGSQQEAQRIYDLAKELGVPVWRHTAAGAFLPKHTYVVFDDEIMCYGSTFPSGTEVPPAEFEARLRGEWSEEKDVTKHLQQTVCPEHVEFLQQELSILQDKHTELIEWLLSLPNEPISSQWLKEEVKRRWK